MMTRCMPVSSAVPSLVRCRLSMPRMATSSRNCRPSWWKTAITGRRRMPIRVPPRSRARPPTAPSWLLIWPACRSMSCMCPANRRMRPSGGPARRACGSMASRWSSICFLTRANMPTRTGTMPRSAWCRHPSATSFIRTVCGRAFRPAACRLWPPTIAPSQPSRSASALVISPRSRMVPAALRTACRCSGHMAWGQAALRWTNSLPRPPPTSPRHWTCIRARARSLKARMPISLSLTRRVRRPSSTARSNPRSTTMCSRVSPSRVCHALPWPAVM